MHNQESPASGWLFILATSRFFDELGWAHPPQRRMGTTLVLVYAPGPDFAPGILYGNKPVPVQALPTQIAVE
jgi:hypothetical protein